MAVVLWGVLIVLALTMSALAILLLTPLHIRISGKTGTPPVVNADLRTLWGLSPRLRLPLTGLATPTETVAKKEKDRPDNSKRKARSSPSGRLSTHSFRAIADFLSSELSRIHIDRLHANAVFGLADPADTGQLFGMLTPLIYGLPGDRVDLALAPDFSGPRFDGDGEARLHFTPAALIVPVIRLALRLKGVTR